MTEELLLQYLILFGISIFFTGISITRQTFITLLIAGLTWFFAGAANFMLTISGLTTTISYTCMAIGFIFVSAAVYVLFESAQNAKNARWQVGL